MTESNKQTSSRLIKASLNFMNDVKQVASFKLPEHDDLIFSRIWLELRGRSNDDSLSDFDRKNNSKIEERIGELSECLCSLFYHIDNVKKLEKNLNTIIKNYKNSTPLARGGNYNPSVTNRFTFEYHAFAFASVRCVNHMFLALGYICFKKYCPSRKSFCNNSKGKNSAILDLINNTLQKHSILEKLFKNGNQNSIRDQIAHKQFLCSGSLRIEMDQAKLIGILPSKISHYDGQSEPNIYKLSQVMTNQAEKIKQFVMEILGIIMESYLNIPKKDQIFA